MRPHEALDGQHAAEVEEHHGQERPGYVRQLYRPAERQEEEHEHELQVREPAAEIQYVWSRAGDIVGRTRWQRTSPPAICGW